MRTKHPRCILQAQKATPVFILFSVVTGTYVVVQACPANPVVTVHASIAHDFSF